MGKYTFPGRNLKLPGHFWCPLNKPRAVVLALHGMTEHAGRFAALGEFLAERGIALAAFDLRGHGQHQGSPDCAAMGPEDWMLTMDDIRLVLAELERLLPSVPQFLLGFSLGSFLVRDYMATPAPKPAGVILMGTGCQPELLLGLIKAILRTQIKKFGFEASSPLVQTLAFDSYNRSIPNPRTPMDWLCGDSAALDAYLADPLCRPRIAAGLFHELLDSMARTGRRSTYKLWPKGLPVLLLSGEKDPVGANGKGIRRLSRAMALAGLDIAPHIYPGARHALLQEEASGTADRVRQDIFRWLEQQL